MTFEQLIKTLDPDIYQRLKTAVELGKWPNGEKLSEEQRSLCMEAVIGYELEHLPPEQRTGFIDTKKTTACGHEEDESDEAPLRWE